MILENYKIFDIAKKLGFNLNKETNMWDAYSNIILRKKDLINNKIPFKMGNIPGFLYVDEIGLTSFENLPEIVNDDFSLTNNNIINLKELPTTKVGGVLTLSTGTSKHKITDLHSNLESVYGLNLNYMDGLKRLDGIENIDCYSLKIKNLNDLESLENTPPSLMNMFIIKCSSIKNLNGLPKELKELTISGCNNLTSLGGLPTSIESIKLIDNTNLPKLEEDFAVHIGLHGFKNYFLDLLQFTIKAKREDEINQITWPEDFKKDMPKLIRSIGGLNKFNI